jgi:protein O-GlcNAc transferase
MLLKLIRGLLDSGRTQHPGSQVPALQRDSASDAAAGAAGGNPTGAAAEDLLRRAETAAKAGQLSAALEDYRAYIHAHSRALEGYLGLASVLVDLWSIDEAVSAYGRALELAPRSGAVFSALLFHSHYLSPADRRQMFDLHRRFGTMMREAVPARQEKFALAPDPGRRLRVGYVSPNFSRHSVGYFVEPVIRCHDRERYGIYCYYTHPLSDETTARLRRSADGWRDIADANDDAVEHMIRADRIDILVDLAGHSKGNRLGVFARKPAPIQMTWLGYPDTTGLDAVDFRITDRVADPEPDAELRHSERLLRIDDAFLCYQPPDSPPVSERSGSAPGIVFSSFNNIAKLNDETLRVWGKILAAVPGSRIAIKAASLGFPDTVDRVLDCCERSGMDPGRVELRGWIKDRRQHLELYDNIDIALDTFPYNGTTTTCEALWMGVPVVSLAGDAHMSRVGAAILHCVGLSDLVARSAGEYADIAVTLARDAGRRQSLRAGLRSQLLASPLLDHTGFTRKLERHFRQSWTAWCDCQRPV